MDLAWFNIKHDTVDQKLSTNLKKTIHDTT